MYIYNFILFFIEFYSIVWYTSWSAYEEEAGQDWCRYFKTGLTCFYYSFLLGLMKRSSSYSDEVKIKKIIIIIFFVLDCSC